MQVHRNAAMKRKSRKGNRSGEVVTVTVDRRVMREALKLARGDARRLEIVDAHTVVVR